MRKKPITIGDRSFDTQKAALDFARSLRDRYANGVRVVGEDDAFLRYLVDLHPDAGEKIGVGIAHFTVERDSVFRRNRHFVIHRIDGTSTDVSFQVCIKGSTRRSEVLSALRNAIAPQVTEYKDRIYDDNDGYVTCPVKGTRIPYYDAHVDHRPPSTFRAIVNDWLAREGIGIEDVALTPHKDNEYRRFMADSSQRSSWFAFHKAHASLRVVSSAANLSDVRREARWRK